MASSWNYSRISEQVHHTFGGFYRIYVHVGIGFIPVSCCCFFFFKLRASSVIVRHAVCSVRHRNGCSSLITFILIGYEGKPYAFKFWPDWTIHVWVACSCICLLLVFPRYFPTFPIGYNGKIKTKDEYREILHEMMQHSMPFHKIARTNHT